MFLLGNKKNYPCYSFLSGALILTKGDNLCDILFASLNDVSLSKLKDSTLTEIICSKESRFFL